MLKTKNSHDDLEGNQSWRPIIPDIETYRYCKFTVG